MCWESKGGGEVLITSVDINDLGPFHALLHSYGIVESKHEVWVSAISKFLADQSNVYVDRMDQIELGLP